MFIQRKFSLEFRLCLTLHYRLGLPKSANFSSPWSLMSKFWGLRSLWSIFRMWQYCNPLNSWNKKSWKEYKKKVWNITAKYFMKRWYILWHYMDAGLRNVYPNTAQDCKAATRNRYVSKISSTNPWIRSTLTPINYNDLSFVNVWPLTIKVSTPYVRTTYSNTNVSVSLVWTMSWRVTIFACFSPFRSDAATEDCGIDEARNVANIL